MAVKITDLVDPSVFEELSKLKTEMSELSTQYIEVAKELAKGMTMPINNLQDLERANEIYSTSVKEAARISTDLNRVISEQKTVIQETTNVASRRLMEQERVNKATREEYADTEKVKALLAQVNGTYGDNIKALMRINNELATNKQNQDNVKKQYANSKISIEEYNKAMEDLIKEERQLKQEKRATDLLLKNEEREMNAVEGSYNHMSQQLELLKKAYKSLTEEELGSALGKELETTIQNLDAHLKDLAADIGEFQRNVGNYAIAGQNGVVSTESLTAVIQQEARTMQDLVDQTKILEEAKRMLNTEDANYSSTLEAINQKIEENKRKLSDVSDILNQEARSVGEAEEQNKRLKEALKHVDLTSDGAKERIAELNAKIEANTALIRENTPAVNEQAKAAKKLTEELERQAKEQDKAAKKLAETLEKQSQAQAKAAADQAKASEGLASNMMSLIGLNNKFGSSLKGLKGLDTGSILDGLNIKVKAFGKTLMGLLSNPWMLTFLGIAGVAAGVKWWYDYNKGLIEASRLTENFTGATGEAADKVTVNIQTIADEMGKDYKETIVAANTMVQHFGISWDEAIEKIKDGIQAGANMSGNFVENINRFAPALRDAGVTADQFVAILSNTRKGIFDEKGVNDIVKGGTKLRSMTKQISQSLDDVGISSKKMQKDLEEGNITMLEAVQQVAAKLKELPENSQEAGAVMKNVFGRTAAEGGTLLIQSIADINTNLDECKDSMGELGKLNREQMEAQTELNETVAAVFKMSGTNFEKMTVQAKTYIAKGLKAIIVNCVDIVNWFIRIYNRSLAVRIVINSISSVFKTLWEVSKFTLSQLVNTFKAVGSLIEGILTLDWDVVKKGCADAMKALERDFTSMAKSMAASGAEAFKNTLEGEMKEISVSLDGEIPDAPSNKPQTPPSALPPKGLSEAEKKRLEREEAKRRKEAEKRAKEELKRLQELEDSKIAVMEEGHEKELALIRQKFKKKLDKITGNGATENALRMQLAEECEKEIADCELKYQQELSKINLANRLALVKEGSKEELNLKLAQIEANRKAELDAAKKTGADITLINEKFNAQRQKLEEEYADKFLAQKQKQFAAESEERSTKMIGELNDLKAQYAEELKLHKQNADKREEITEKFERAAADIQYKYAHDEAQAAINMLEESLKVSGLSADEQERIRRELAEARMKLSDEETEHELENIKETLDADEDAKKKRLQAIQKWLQVAADSLNAINDLSSAIYDNKIQKIEDEQEAFEASTQKESDLISELVDKQVISQEEGDARKRALDEKKAKKNEELELKKQKLKERQAIWDKANSIAQSAIATALAVTQALPNVVMAAIVGALGAIQLATIIATPIPKYAKGTDYHAGGLALVGDGGRKEMVITGEKFWITPDVPTLVDLPKGASVLPSVPAITPERLLPEIMPTAPVVVNNDNAKLCAKIDKLGDRLENSIYGMSKSIQKSIQKGAYLAEYEKYKRNRV